MAPLFQISLNRNHSASSSSESSTSSAHAYSTIATSPESPSHVYRKLTKRRRLLSLSSPNQQLGLITPSHHHLDTSSLTRQDSPPRSQSPECENSEFGYLPTTPDSEEQLLPPAIPRPGSRSVAIGEDLITRWSRMDVSDDVLIAELEKLRKAKIHYGQSDAEFPHESEWPASEHEEHPRVLDHSPESEWPEDEDRRWKKARRALFCCRELIRTELSYLDGLLQLENSETTTPPPLMLAYYLPALVVASIDLSVKMLSDPTAYGVSRAFVEAEHHLETAFVPWCRIIGEVFCDRGSPGPRRWLSTSDGHRKLTRAGQAPSSSGGHMRGHSYGHGISFPTRNSTMVNRQSRFHNENDNQVRYSSNAEQDVGGGNGVVRLFRRLSFHSPPKPPQPHTPEADQNMRSRMTHSESLSLPHRSHSRKRESHHPTVHSSENPLAHTPNTSREHSRHRHHRSDGYVDQSRPPRRHRRHTVKISTAKDLAIQPTQRVVRYVLLYRDLLDQTSDRCLSRPFVERALESATRMARKCDEAQCNAAFLRSP